jgi:hypothetical protein
VVFAAPPPPDFNAQCGNIACRVERVPAQWYLAGVGDDPRTLKLVYLSGGCRRGDGRAQVSESGSRIRIAVDESVVVAMDTPDRQVACTMELRLRRLRVTLERPVAGRRVVGPERVDGPVGAVDRRVPRVIGLAAVDAAAVLRLHGYKVRRYAHKTGTVAFQSPLPGKRVGQDEGRRRPGEGVGQPSTAGITLGRDAFNARALKSCLRAPRFRALAGRPDPGDEDAPDLELTLGSSTAPGLVALYADPARAEENEPGIRRNVRGSEAIVERLGRATIVWFRPPAPALRAHVRGCVAGARP